MPWKTHVLCFICIRDQCLEKHVYLVLFGIETNDLKIHVLCDIRIRDQCLEKHMYSVLFSLETNDLKKYLNNHPLDLLPLISQIIQDEKDM